MDNMSKVEALEEGGPSIRYPFHYFENIPYP